MPLYKLNSSKFPEDSAVHSQDSPYTLQGIAGTPPQMLLITPELLLLPGVTYSGEYCQISQKIINSGKSLEQSHSPQTIHHYIEIPQPSGIHSELMRHFKQGEIFTISLAYNKMDNAPHWVPTVAEGWFMDNLSIVFVHWAFSINNKVGLVSSANVY